MNGNFHFRGLDLCHFQLAFKTIRNMIQFVQKFKRYFQLIFSFNRGEGGSIVENSIRFVFFYFDDLLEDTAASRLYRALHGDRTDVSAVIEILTSHSRQQRNKISKAYKFNHNKVKGSISEFELLTIEGREWKQKQ